mgnify:CR=1 FL=1
MAEFAGRIDRDEEVAVEASVVTVECAAGTSRGEETLAWLAWGVSNADVATAGDEER